MSHSTYPALCPDCLQPLTVSWPQQKHECKAVAVGPVLTCIPSEELDRLRAENAAQALLIASLKERELALKDSKHLFQTDASNRIDTLTQQLSDTQRQNAELMEDNEQAYISLSIEGVRPNSLCEGIAELMQRVGEAEKDAERYRYFRRCFCNPYQRIEISRRLGVEDSHFEPSLDYSIDAALAQSPSVGQKGGSDE